MVRSLAFHTATSPRYSPAAILITSPFCATAAAALGFGYVCPTPTSSTRPVAPAQALVNAAGAGAGVALPLASSAELSAPAAPLLSAPPPQAPRTKHSA